MTNDTENIEQALAIISQIERARASESLEDLTEAELVASLSESWGDGDPDTQKLIACGEAIMLRHHDLAGAAELLCELGIDDFDPDVLATIHFTSILYEMSTAEGHREHHSCDWQNPDALTLACVEKHRSLSLRIGAVVLGRNDDDHPDNQQQRRTARYARELEAFRP
jgi:hypothetical protein